MSTFRSSKLNFEHHKHSDRVLINENVINEPIEKISRIPKYPKRTYSLEGKGSTCFRKRSTRNKTSTTSMIPRPDWSKPNKKTLYVPSSANPKEKRREQQQLKRTNSENKIRFPKSDFETTLSGISAIPRTLTFSPKKTTSLEDKVNDDFKTFKNSVLKIPEYWTDAGQTVSNILKNAINIVTKQYPNMDVDTFETEIENILKATEAVKQQILSKTEHIIHKANKIYQEETENDDNLREEDFKKIARKMEQLRTEVNLRKNVFDDLIKCGSEMRHLVESKKLKRRGTSKENLGSEHSEDSDRKISFEGQQKLIKGKKQKAGVEPDVNTNKRVKNLLRSCGDIFRQQIANENAGSKSDSESLSSKEEKQTQTINFWTAELHKREDDLNELKREILELHQLCKNHISRFKSFNLQIKLKGLCNKAQHKSVTQELQNLSEEKEQLEEKNNKLLSYNQNLESAIKQRDADLHHKEKLIHQQKKLLHVRDELIEMLKSRCNVVESKVCL